MVAGGWHRVNITRGWCWMVREGGTVVRRRCESKVAVTTCVCRAVWKMTGIDSCWRLLKRKMKERRKYNTKNLHTWRNEVNSWSVCLHESWYHQFSARITRKGLRCDMLQWRLCSGDQCSGEGSQCGSSLLLSKPPFHPRWNSARAWQDLSGCLPLPCRC